MKDKFTYCPVCKEPEQMELKSQVHGGRIIVPRQCACVRAMHEAEEKRVKIREHENTVSRNRGICFKQRLLEKCTFENDNGKTPTMTFAKKYVDGWNEVKEKNAGLLLWGGIGSGKTYMAACIANALLEQEKRVLMTDFTTIFNISLYDISEFIRSLEMYALLIIDDLGAERNSEFALQNVYDVINNRNNSGKPLLITTNLKLEEIQREESLTKKRIYDRILGMCVPVHVEGNSKRKAVAGKKEAFLMQLFEVNSGGEIHE